MWKCFGCFKTLVWGDEGSNAPLDAPDNTPSIELDTANIGTDVVIVKQGRRICGAGAALASSPIVQDKAYFEIKIQSTGIWSVGLATKKCNVQNALGGDEQSWVLQHDGLLLHSGQQKGKVPVDIEEGDTIGITYDHVQLLFYKNGKSLDTPITGLKGTLFPAFYVDDGAILDASFANFFHAPPPGYEQIMIEQNLL